MANNISKRIIYIDLLRAFAVIMMIQGHTVDAFLAEEFRSSDSLLYSIWRTMRGFTAPIFMFTAGLIFTYLLKPNHYKVLENPRIIKGIKRGITLIIIGYILRYPTFSIFDFSNVSETQWRVFFTVDALHLIGLGLLFIIASVFVAKRSNISLNFILILQIIVLLILSPVINKIHWNNILPQYLAAYFTNIYGSLFPLFPWLVYILFGSLLGNFLYKNNDIYLKKRFSAALLSTGSGVLFFAFLLYSLEAIVEKEVLFWVSSTAIVLLRIGYVILISGIIAFVVRKFKSIPTLVIETGKKTLLLYVLHVVILYGCAWFPGLYKYYAKSFTPIETILATLFMLGFMLLIVQFSGKINFSKKSKLLFNKIKIAK